MHFISLFIIEPKINGIIVFEFVFDNFIFLLSFRVPKEARFFYALLLSFCSHSFQDPPRQRIRARHVAANTDRFARSVLYSLFSSFPCKFDTPKLSAVLNPASSPALPRVFCIYLHKNVCLRDYKLLKIFIDIFL